MGNFFSRKEERRIIMQGLDAAGKTSLLYRLKLGEVVTTIPTIGFNVETVECKGIYMTCWDVGGRAKIRPLYRHYYQNTQGFVFVIDSNDKERLDEALDEFVKSALLEEELKDCVVMVMANKQDLPGAMSAQEIEDALKKKYTFSKNCSRTVFVMPCSVTTGDGIWEAFDDFANQLRLKKEGKAEPGLISRSTRDAQMAVESSDQSKNGTFALKAVMKNPIGYFKSLLYRVY